MTDALSIIYYIFNKFLILLFDTFEMFPNVTIGWVIVAIIIISIMASNILSMAKAHSSEHITGEQSINYNGNTYKVEYNRFTGRSK